MKMLQEAEGAVKRDYNPYLNIVRSPSPSVNFIWGNTHGLPRGYTAVFYGPPRGGKSVLANSFIGQLHRDDPEAIALKIDTEFREELQMTDRQLQAYGIDLDRYQAIARNDPKVFDFIETQVNALCQEGAPIKLIVIDSLQGLLGRRSGESIENQTIGDEAKTIQDGLKRIITTIRRNRIALILTAHVRAEMDIRKAKYNPTKMAAAWGLKHFAEYYVNIVPNNDAEAKKDILGHSFETTLKDIKGEKDKFAHKVRVCMKNTSAGPKGRVGEFTFSDYNGIINTYEEVYQLATRRQIVERPNNKTFVIKDFPTQGEEQKYVGKKDFALAIKENDLLYNELLKRVVAQDVEAMRTGQYPQLAVNMAENEDENTPDTADEEESSE